MTKIFKSMDEGSIFYCKIYSTYRYDATKDCIAFILMPSSLQRHKVSLQSMQFDFNASGHVMAISFHFVGHEDRIQKKVQELLDGIAELKGRYAMGMDLDIVNLENTLTVRLLSWKDSEAVLSDTIDFIKDSLYMKTEFAQETKSQLLSQSYLAQEFIRLRGKDPLRGSESLQGIVQQKDKGCSIM